MAAVRIIVPAKPSIEERVTVEVALLPADTTKLVELVEMLKFGGGGGATSTTVTWKETE
jgi:hypothetical protein